MIVSLGAVHPAPAAAPTKTHDCCKKNSQPAPAKKACHNGLCAMQCCRMIPAPVDSAPELSGHRALVEVAIVSPTVLHSLADPEAIFHPPRV
jgi:hypothetical protein